MSTFLDLCDELLSLITELEEQCFKTNIFSNERHVRMEENVKNCKAVLEEMMNTLISLRDKLKRMSKQTKKEIDEEIAQIEEPQVRLFYTQCKNVNHINKMIQEYNKLTRDFNKMYPNM